MKNNIGITIIAACVLLIGTSFTYAQTFNDFKKMPDTQKAKFIADSLKAGLNLDSKQYDKVYHETLAGIKKVSPVVKGDGSRMEKLQQLRLFLTEEEKNLKIILTPQQFALYQTKKQKAIAYYMQHVQNQKIIFNVQ